MHAPPSFKDLPFHKDGPPYNAWGLYGKGDELGRLNLITPEVVKAGQEEIVHGIVINLNLPQDFFPSVHPDRAPIHHEINHRGYCNDDIVTLNTQTTTQWDGFKHYPYKNWPTKGQYVFYNGQSNEDAREVSVLRNGIQNFAKKPITSRGVLLDIKRYIDRYERTPLSYFDRETPISVSLLKEVQKDQGVNFRRGDVLLIRTGWTEKILQMDPEKVKNDMYERRAPVMGVAQGEEMLEWHWDNEFAAVASDVPAYEAMPESSSPSCHEVFLAGWGMPIGEMFDLRELAAECERLGKWTFFFTSMPLYLSGGVASPPNAQAIL